jgi:predicted MFS family arabinose efflux permease
VPNVKAPAPWAALAGAAIGGAIIGYFGYSSVLLFALISVLLAFGIVAVLKEMQPEQPQA